MIEFAVYFVRTDIGLNPDKSNIYGDCECLCRETYAIMGQASVLTDTEVRRVFRIIETTRHASRNRVAFVLSIFAGLRVGEIASLTVGDVSTPRVKHVERSNSLRGRRRGQRVERSFCRTVFAQKSTVFSRTEGFLTQMHL
jgi:integrase